MGLRAIALRDETVEALRALMDKANESQKDAYVELSDVIDALYDIMASSTEEDTEVVEAIVRIAKKN